MLLRQARGYSKQDTHGQLCAAFKHGTMDSIGSNPSRDPCSPSTPAAWGN